VLIFVVVFGLARTTTTRRPGLTLDQPGHEETTVGGVSLTKNALAAAELKSIFDIFSRKSIINLATRPDRRRRNEAQFSKFGTAPSEAGFVYFDARRFSDRGLFVNSGVRGCFQSHLDLLRACQASGEPALICEDDVSFNMKALVSHKGLSRKIMESRWDIIYFGLCDPLTGQSRGIVPYTGSFNGLHCYAIRPEIAGRAANYFEASLSRLPGHPLGGCIHPDGALNDFRRKNPDVISLISNPFVAEQFSSRSDLGMHPWYDDVKMLRPVLAAFRQLRST
jgi:glycosyl transferase, family 25